MKKVYLKTKDFLVNHRKISIFICALLFVISALSLIYSSVKLLVAATFGFSLSTMLRLTTYKVGKIPVFMTDTTWNSYELKYGSEYSKEELETKYKEMSIRRAALYFLLCIISFLIWAICELILTIS